MKNLLELGSTGIELETDFKGVIDEYLEDCTEADIIPEKPFKGSFNVRIPSELHRDAPLTAKEFNTSLNSFVSESIKERLNSIQKRSSDSRKIISQKVTIKKGTRSRKTILKSKSRKLKA